MTIKDLAKIAGVSHSTVSRSLNNSPLISEKTKNIIKALAKEHNFEFNASARSLSTRKTDTIGIIFPEMYDDYRNLQYLGSLLNNLRSTLEKAQLDSIVTFSKNIHTGESNIKNLIRRNKVDGLLLVVPEIMEEDWELIEKTDIPHVILHFKQKNVYSNGSDYIYTDHFKGGYLAAECLIKSGCRKILTITEDKKYLEYRERTNGYKQALTDNKIKIDEKLIVNRKCSFQSGYDFIIGYPDIINKIDGVFAQADLTAIGVIEAFKEIGKKIPDEVQIVGYDDIEIGTFFKPRLTTIHQPREKHALLACERLVKLINKEKINIKMQMTVEPRLIIRESCRGKK